MTAYEALTALLEAFQEALPEVEFREALGPGEASRLIVRPTVTGEVSKETAEGDSWSAKLAFVLYLPRESRPAAAEGILNAMGQCARESQPLLAGIQRGALAVDKPTGSTAVGWTLSLAEPGGGSGGSQSGGKAKYQVYINGEAHTVTGWKASDSESGGSLTAIGEDAPFVRRTTRGYTVELQGLDLAGLEALENFSLRLGGQSRTYTGCRWKSLSAGGTGVLTAAERLEG